MKIIIPISAAASLFLCGATTGLAQTVPSYESNGFPITPLQAQAVSPKDMQERVSDPALAAGSIQPSTHQAAVLGTLNQMAQERGICAPSTIAKSLPSWESKGYAVTSLEIVIFAPKDVQERVTDPGGGRVGG